MLSLSLLHASKSRAGRSSPAPDSHTHTHRSIGRPAPPPAHRADTSDTAGDHFALIRQNPPFFHTGRCLHTECAPVCTSLTSLTHAHTHALTRSGWRGAGGAQREGRSVHTGEAVGLLRAGGGARALLSSTRVPGADPGLLRAAAVGRRGHTRGQGHVQQLVRAQALDRVGLGPCGTGVRLTRTLSARRLLFRFGHSRGHGVQQE